ncbi:rhomboid family intramembrane serine protease [Nakamurella deserti]|uniref:rhomboid family intramembrane serine protease n=1 Tax=Nakamurella deserti TaxID=2164074 RepID=UPI000DBE7272|nr:rhomboid family intramembrane serine protease [Nakamurella deserti]
MTQPPPGHQPAAQVGTACTWHPDRHTALSCSRCGRPACPECLTPASVGFHCRQCVAESNAQRPVARTIAGGVAGRQPMVAVALIVVNVVVFLITMVQGGGESSLLRSPVFREGALSPMYVASGDWWQLVTSGFLHGGVAHIAMNMLSLYLIGVGLERFLGAARFVALYGLSLLGGSVAVYLLTEPNSLTVGASGAIFGLLGALLVIYKRLRLDLRQLGVILALNAFITFTVSSISWQGHLGGFVVGAVVGAAMVYAPPKNRLAIQVGVSVGVLVVLLALIVVRNGTIGDWVCTVNACRQIG